MNHCALLDIDARNTEWCASSRGIHCRTLHRKLKYDKSTKSYLCSSCPATFPDNRKQMQKRTRLNIRRARSQKARHRMSDTGQLTVPVVIRSDDRRVRPEALPQREKDVTGRRVQPGRTSHTHRQMQVWTVHRKRKSFHQST